MQYSKLCKFNIQQCSTLQFENLMVDSWKGRQACICTYRNEIQQARNKHGGGNQACIQKTQQERLSSEVETQSKILEKYEIENKEKWGNWNANRTLKPKLMAGTCSLSLNNRWNLFAQNSMMPSSLFFYSFFSFPPSSFSSSIPSSRLMIFQLVACFIPCSYLN